MTRQSYSHVHWRHANLQRSSWIESGSGAGPLVIALFDRPSHIHTYVGLCIRKMCVASIHVKNLINIHIHTPISWRNATR